jgi:hypothetical protein
MTPMHQDSTQPIGQKKSDQQDQVIRMANQRDLTTTSRGRKTLRDDSETDCESPISPSKEFCTNKTEKPFRFYLYVREKLPEWWQEFNTALNESGMLKYRSVRQFALAKVKNRRRQELLCEMIGPRPQETSARALAR